MFAARVGNSQLHSWKATSKPEETAPNATPATKWTWLKRTFFHCQSSHNTYDSYNILNIYYIIMNYDIYRDFVLQANTPQCNSKRACFA